jgi:hypothetical protein
LKTYLKLRGYTGKEVMPHKIVLDDEGQQWWKENGTTWEGEFDLSDNSESMRILENYIAEKKAKANSKQLTKGDNL